MQANLSCKEDDACSICYVNIKDKLLHSLLDIIESYQKSTVKNEEPTKVR
jgi:hypothetical protein